MAGKNQLERILKIDSWLRAERYPSKKWMAGQFGITGKTVERDIEFMRDRLCAPVAFVRGRNGYHYTRKNYFLPSMNLASGELLALFLSSRLASSMRDTPLAKHLDRAVSKLAHQLPDEVRVDPAFFDSTVSIIDRSVPVDTRIWIRLATAAHRNVKAAIAHRAAGYSDCADRVVHPYRLVHHRDAWYLLAHDEGSETVRRFAVNRISAVKVLHQQRFHLPEGFAIEDHVDLYAGIFDERESFHVALKFASTAGDIAGERRWGKDCRRHRDTDGSVIIEFDTNQQEELLHNVLQWGPYVEVIEPQVVRRELIRRIEAMRAIYS